jgi:hypothetical protein
MRNVGFHIKLTLANLGGRPAAQLFVACRLMRLVLVVHVTSGATGHCTRNCVMVCIMARDAAN